MIDTRQRILEATERVVRTEGLAGATTRRIVQEVGCAEGTLYVHFRDRAELFLAVLVECLPQIQESLRHLPSRVGRNTVRANLEEVVIGTLGFHARVMPLFAGLLAEPGLLAAYQRGLRERGGGPHRSRMAVAAYLLAEQKGRRVHSTADAEMAAMVLIHSCFGRVFEAMFVGEELTASDNQRFAKKLVGSLWRGLAPRRNSSD